jgi:hypothetical protein
MKLKLLAIGCFLLVACGNRNAKFAEESGNFAMAEIADQSATQPATISIERKLIKNGSVEFEVGSVNETKEKITSLVKDAGGYISSENQNNYGGSPRYEQVARIPADKLDDFVSQIEKIAKKVDSKSISTQDVTEEFIDVETRLATKKELELRYRDLLKQAKSVKDIIEVEAQLNNVRSEIESMEGRLKYLNSQVSYSTLTVSYYQAVSGNYGFGYRFLNSFGEGWRAFLNFVIGIFAAWPFVIIIGLGLWLFVRWKRNKRANG